MHKDEDVTPATIEAAKVRFVSGKDLDAGLASAEFKKAPESKKDKPDAAVAVKVGRQYLTRQVLGIYIVLAVLSVIMILPYKWIPWF